ncbi:hypothetical protein EN45_074440 [Penicillium chrysogenum]|uniref:F-box domain-containing protein n=1 Tax=Penicillium chrysogenum TaxID=5076 RepID=A0A167U2I3_PENCH|nr:hypothetical protein EN45_074440 [Penicillium chrysogenum]
MTLYSIFRSAHRKEKRPVSRVSRLSQPKTSKLPNGQIPAEILDLIYEQLPVLEQLYFALTCKYLYDHFVSFLKTRDPDHAKLLIPSEKRLPIYRNAELGKRPRIQLLRQLENERWKCCVVFDICPCLSIAFNERQLLLDILSSLEDSKTLFPEDFIHDSQWMKLSHYCKVTSHPYAQAAIKTEFYKDDYESIRVRNTYTFDFPEGLAEAGLDYSAWGEKAFPTATKRHMFKVVTERDLGRKTWDKRGWKVNRNDRG